MIVRVWQGWTTPDHADEYEQLVHDVIIPRIAARNIPGYQGIQLFRRTVGFEVEFMTVMRFESMEAVRQFGGKDYEQAYVPPEARELLTRFDERSRHFEMRARIDYTP